MNPKHQKVLSDTERAEKKKSEIEGQLKELYDKKTELENLEIINTVRSMVMDKDQIMVFLSSMKGGTKPAGNTEVIDNAQEVSFSDRPCGLRHGSVLLLGDGVCLRR